MTKTIKVVMALGAMFAAACSGQASNEPAQVGSASAALIDNSTGTKYGASCRIKNAVGTEYWLFATGQTGAASFSRNVEVLDTTGATVVGPVAIGAAGDERRFAKLIEIDDSHCLLATGDQAGSPVTPVATTFKITVGFSGTNVPNSITVASAGSLNIARAQAELVKCGNTFAVISGQKVVMGTASDENTIEVWNGTNSWSVLKDGSNNNITLPAFHDGASAYDSNGIVVAGGLASGTQTNKVIAIKPDANCSTGTVVTDLTAATFASLTNARSALVGFFKETHTITPGMGSPYTASEYVFAAGYTGSATVKDTDRITIDWSSVNSNHSAKTAEGNLPNALERPALAYNVNTTGTAPLATLVGGDNAAATPLGVTDVSTYASGSWTAQTALGTARGGGAAVKLGAHAYVAGGFDANGTPNLLDTVVTAY